MAITISSAHYGWVCGEKRNPAGYVIDVRWTKYKEGAKPYRDNSRDLEDVRAHLYKRNIAHDVNHIYSPYVDG